MTGTDNGSGSISGLTDNMADSGGGAIYNPP
jgi:hypothetical protein